MKRNTLFHHKKTPKNTLNFSNDLQVQNDYFFENP